MTSLVENIASASPDAQISILIRKDNKPIFEHNPHIKHILVWNKRKHKYRNLIKLIRRIRAENFDYVFNIQRFFTTGLITLLSGGKVKIGYKKNPLSLGFNHKIKHSFNGKHEVERLKDLLSKTPFETDNNLNPKIYLTPCDFKQSAQILKTQSPFIAILPGSAWATKQTDISVWIQLIKRLKAKYPIYLLGSAQDARAADQIIKHTMLNNNQNLCGKLSVRETAAMMKRAMLNYVNDSAPAHIASAINAPVVQIFCSTIPKFGYSALSTRSWIVEPSKPLDCRPCGLHGKKQCPKTRFECGKNIHIDDLIAPLKKVKTC